MKNKSELFIHVAHLVLNSILLIIISPVFLSYLFLCLSYLYEMTLSFQKASALHCYNYNCNYKFMDLSHCPTHFFILRSSYLSICLIISPMHLPNLLTISGNISEVCLRVVVLGGLSIPDSLCNVLLLSFVTLPPLIRE